jgi:two-component system, chemotaxis family, CheB/CheR fusion protein
MTNIPNANDFPIAVVGASAGGLQALQAFVAAISDDTSIAYIIIQHSTANSQLAPILQKDSPLPIVLAQDEEPIEAGKIYVIPGQMNPEFENNTIRLVSNLPAQQMRHPIDFSLRSLAQNRRDKIIAVVLSGTDADGALGIRAVKEVGGLVIAQAPETAQFEQMPRSAIATGLVDYILSPDEMPEKIVEFVTNMLTTENEALAATPADVDELLTRIFVLLQSRTNHDFSQYKKKTVIRRIQRRIALNQLADLEEYATYLRQHPEEAQMLFSELLIGVTSFFRDKNAFEQLQTKVIPEIFEQRKNDGIIRVWSVGCSTGEEAYSIAILLHEYADTLPEAYKIQVFATDIDDEAIAHARTGRYPINIAADITPEHLNRFFTEENGHYIVRKHIRDSITFAVQNVIKDPPFSRLDLVICRNLLIYMESELQERLIPLFHYVLVPNGYLFLGTSETLRSFSHLFQPIDKKWKIFRRIIDGSQLRLSFDLSRTRAPSPIILKQGVTPREMSLKETIEATILEDFTRPCVIVDARGEILYLHKRTDKYLEPPVGEVTNNILRMAREGLRLPLTTALSRIHHLDGETEITFRNLRIQKNGGYISVNLLVALLLRPNALRGYILIMFEDVQGSGTIELQAINPDQDETGVRRVAELEQDLASTKEYLQAVVEELEASNEELKSMNEELHASNEEMQSSNEELETASEELQSVNEELRTANSELENKIDELDESSRQLNDLLNNVDLGIIFLDRELRIMRYTPSVKRVMNLIAADMGRPLSDLVFKLDDMKLVEHAHDVLNTLVSKRLEIHTQADTWHWITIKPYRTINDAIIGVVITFVDVTELGRSRQRSQSVEDNTAQRNLESRQLLKLHTISYEWQRFAMQQHTADELLQECCQLLSTLVDVQSVLIYLPDSATAITSSGIDAEQEQVLIETFNQHDLRPEIRAISTGEVIIVNNIPASSAYDSIRQLVETQGYESVIALPIHTEQRIIGFVVLYCQPRHLFSESEVQLLQLIVNHLGSRLTLI